MTPVRLSELAIRRQVDRILESSGFLNNQRLSGFLRFVVERQLTGRTEELKESVIGVEVLGRPADYNPKKDSIVRAEAGRLRARLSEYYIGEGAADPLIIELPKGGYIPSFREIQPSENDSNPATLPPQRAVSIRLVLAIAAASIVVAALAWWTVHKSAPVPIAVLPLENLNHDPGDDYLADGLTDELIRTLSGFDGLAPRSRTSSFALKGKARTAREAGAALSVDYIVEGSVLRAGDKVRIDTQLVRTRDDYPVWSGKFERNTSDVLGLQEEISRTIVANLPIKIGNGRKHSVVNPEAYNLYLRARSLGLQDGVAAFEEAISKDPSFAPAYAGLASAYAYNTGNAAKDSARELPKMHAAAEKALELDPLLPEAHSAMGMAYAREGKWALSEKSFRRAIGLNPNRSESYGDFSVYVLMQEGRITEALQEMRQAQKADPLSPEVRSELAYVLMSSHLWDEAAEECEKLPEDCNCWPAPRERVRYECLGRARLGQGRTKEGLEILAAGVAKGVPVGAPMRGYLAYAYGLNGQRAEAQKIIDAAWRNPYHQAIGLSGLGEKDRAIEAMERMVLAGPVRVGLALAVPELDSIRNDPRIKRFRKEIGLPN